MVVAQMDCSFMLVMGASLLWVSLRRLLAVDPGFRTENVITGAIGLTSPRHAADDAARAFVNRSLESIRQLPGVTATGATQTGVIIAEGYAPITSVRLDGSAQYRLRDSYQGRTDGNRS